MSITSASISDFGFRISDFSVQLMISNLQFKFRHLFSGFHELFSKFSIRIPQSAFVGPVAWSPQEPGLMQAGLGTPQCMSSGPRLPLVLQKARTAHLASKLTLFTSGFLYSFFVFFSKVFPYKCSVCPVEPVESVKSLVFIRRLSFSDVILRSPAGRGDEESLGS